MAELHVTTEIGFMIAKAFAANGVKVYITGRRLDVLEQATASVTGVSGSIIPIQMDVNDEGVKAGAKHIEGIDGKLDILVNKYIFSLNMIAPFFIIRTFQALVKGARFRPQGMSSVINVSSATAKMDSTSPLLS
ncbi:uncharacterized protein EV420DRAFT_1578570, partial [Desarmillaria tabescens]